MAKTTLDPALVTAFMARGGAVKRLAPVDASQATETYKACN